MPKTYPSYSYVTHKETKEQGYKIAEGKYAGVVWLYKDVRLPFEDDFGNRIDPEQVEKIPLTFGYEVLYNPTDEDLKSDEFRNIIGDILLEVIDASLEHDTVQFNAENRNSDTE